MEESAQPSTLIIMVHFQEGFELANNEVLEVGIELVKDTDNLVNLVIVRFKEHRALAVFQPFGIYPVGIGKQLDDPVVERLAAFFQRGNIALGNVYFFAEFLLRQTERVTQFKKTAADILIHCYKPSKKTAEKQGSIGKGFIEDTIYPQKI
jgi:hypothetical protein